MKKLISLLLIFALGLSLCACGVSSNAASSFITRVDGETFDPASVSDNERSRMFESDVFKDAVIARLTGDDSIKSVCTFLAKLESMGYENQDVQAAFQDMIANYLNALPSSDDNINAITDLISALRLLSEDSFYNQSEELFVSAVCDLITGNKLTLIRSNKPVEDETGKFLILANELAKCEYDNEALKAQMQAFIQQNITDWSADSIVRFADAVQLYAGDHYYFSPEDFFPYDAVKNLAESEGTLLSISDGFYSQNPDEFENVHYWHDPLDGKKYSSGGVGLFEKTIQYTPYGDFMYRDYKYIAYSSSGKGRGDEIEQYLWLRWKFTGDDNNYNLKVFKSLDNIKEFLSIAKRGNIYCFENSHKELLIAVIEKDLITFVVEDRGVMFSVSYS